MIKKAIRISILLVLLFTVIVILTAKIEKPVDGENIYGFPLIFLTEYGGKADHGFSAFSFNFLNLLIDLLPVTILALVVDRSIATIIRKTKTDTQTTV
jgi:hypothetical protein